MKWVHEFYQRNPNDYSGFYYFSQRKARAILESIQEIKRGLYKAKVVSIESDNEFKVMGQCGGCTYQYKIGEIFTLRKHKNKNPLSYFSDRFWYDTKNPGKPHTEKFELIEENKNLEKL